MTLRKEKQSGCACPVSWEGSKTSFASGWIFLLFVRYVVRSPALSGLCQELLVHMMRDILREDIGGDVRRDALSRLKHSGGGGLEVTMEEPTCEDDVEWGQVFSTGDSARSFVEGLLP